MASRQRKSLWDGVIEAVQGVKEAPPSSISEDLLRMIRGHAAAEEDSLALYAELRNRSPDPVVRLLLSELLADEEHHHKLLERMETQLTEELDWSSAEFTPPASSFPPTPASKADIASVEKLARHENQGVKHLHDMAKQNAEIHSGLFSLLLDAMASDSQKHERILRFIMKRMESEG